MNRLLVLTIFASGCTAAVCDPVGTYELSRKAGAGDCGLADSVFDVAITEVRDSYVFNVVTDGAMVASVVGDVYVPDQDDVECRVDLTVIYESLVAGAVVSEVVALNTLGANVVGRGRFTIAFADGTGCEQEMLFEGVIK